MEALIQYFTMFFANAARYFVLAGIPFLIFYKFIPYKFIQNKIQKQLAEKKDFIREILYSLQTTVIFATIGFLLEFTPLRNYTQMYSDVSDFPIWWIPVSVAISLILHDTYFYWMHKVAHHPKLFKKIHVIHHKSIKPSPWTSYSFQLSEGILEAMIGPIILFLIPMHPISMVLFITISFLFNVYGHLGYEIAPQWFRSSFLFEIMNTSVHHNLHHEKFKGNYGLYFRVWDRIMKTEHPDYISKYDEIQMRRFGEENTIKISKWKTAFLLGIMTIGLTGFTLVSTKKEIIGEWISIGNNNKGIVEIFQKEDGKYYGKLIKNLAPVESQAIENKVLYILQDFDYNPTNRTGEGKIYVPSKDITVDGEILLLESGKLKVTGSLFGLEKSFIWTKNE